MFVYLKKKEFKLLYKNDEAKRYVLIYAVYYIHKQYNFFFLCMLKCIFSKIFTISFYSHLAVVFPSTVSLCPLPSFPYSLFEMIHLFYFSRFCLWKCFRLFYNGSRNFVIFNVNHYEQKINFVLIVMYNVPHKTVTKLSTIRLWFLNVFVFLILSVNIFLKLLVLFLSCYLSSYVFVFRFIIAFLWKKHCLEAILSW